mgnify:CR=1 FL=1
MYKDKSILIVDDSPIVRGLISKMLDEVGFESIEQIDNYMDRMESALTEINRG